MQNAKCRRQEAGPVQGDRSNSCRRGGPQADEDAGGMRRPERQEQQLPEGGTPGGGRRQEAGGGGGRREAQLKAEPSHGVRKKFLNKLCF